MNMVLCRYIRVSITALQEQYNAFISYHKRDIHTYISMAKITPYFIEHSAGYEKRECIPCRPANQILYDTVPFSFLCHLQPVLSFGIGE